MVLGCEVQDKENRALLFNASTTYAASSYLDHINRDLEELSQANILTPATHCHGTG